MVLAMSPRNWELQHYSGDLYRECPFINICNKHSLVINFDLCICICNINKPHTICWSQHRWV